MKNKILIGIALLLPLSFSMAKESTTSQICLSKSETEIAQCLADEYAKYDLALNNNYKEIMKNLSDEDKKAFKAEQIAWIKEKEKRCAPLANKNGKQACLLDATILKNEQLEILAKPFEAIWFYEYSTDSDEEIYSHNSQHNFYLQSKDIICGIETSEKPPIYRNVKLQQITNSLAKVIKSYDCRFETDCANINIDTDGEDGIYLNSEEKYIDSYISICDGKLTFSTWDGDDGSQCNSNTILQKEILSIDKKNMYIKENPWLKACLNNSKE